MRSSDERVHAFRRERCGPAADPRRTQVQVDGVFARGLRERSRGRRVKQRAQQTGVRDVGVFLRRRRRRRRRREHREWVDAFPQQTPPSQPSVARGEVPEREVIVILDVDRDDDVGAHRLAHHVGGNRVEVPPVHQELAGGLVAHRRQQTERRHAGAHARPGSAGDVRRQRTSRQVRRAAEEGQPQVLHVVLPERLTQDPVQPFAAEHGENREGQVGEQMPRTAQHAHQLLDPREHVRRARVLGVQSRHQSTAARAPHDVHGNAQVLQGAKRAEVRQPVSAAAGEHDANRSPRDVPREPLDVLFGRQTQHVVPLHLGPRRAPPSRRARRGARVVHQDELHGGAAAPAPQQTTLGARRRDPLVSRRRSRDSRHDGDSVRLRHAHLRPRASFGVRLEQDEPVVLLLLRHPAGELTAVKRVRQTSDCSIRVRVARGAFVEQERRTEPREFYTQTRRERRGDALVAVRGRGHERDRHQVGSIRAGRPRF